MTIHGTQQEKKRRPHCYWEFTTVSDAELEQWENSLRHELAGPHRELRAVRREIKRREAKEQNVLSLLWLLESDQSVAAKCDNASDSASVGDVATDANERISPAQARPESGSERP